LTIYLDTSFIAPYYLPEATSADVEMSLRQAEPGTLVVSDWTEVEFASLLSRDVRMGNMLAETATTVLNRFSQDTDLGFYQLLTPTREDFREATRLLLLETSLGLRGPDAIHLALAKHQGATLYTLDKTLLRAAEALGIAANDAGIGTQ
jgi:predicted nucleic acid-binding protein